MEEKKLRFCIKNTLKALSISLVLSSQVLAESYVFVSFSMPEALLKSTFKEAYKLNVPVIFKGLYHNDLKETMHKIYELDEQDTQILIDPRLFAKYAIRVAPALVSSKGSCVDVLYGNLSLSAGLKILEEQGECR
jgi:conjugal transfer pilus assembly protein TrbC